MYKFPIMAAMALTLFSSASFNIVLGQNESVWARPIEKCWSYSSDQMTSFKPASDNESTIFLPVDNDRLLAIDVNTGASVWTIQLKSALISAPTAKNGTLFFAALPASDESLNQGNTERPKGFEIFSVDIESGLNNWKRKIPSDQDGDVDGVSLLLSETLAIAIEKSGKVHALDKTNGKLVWILDTDTSITGFPTVRGNQIILPTQNRTAVFLSLSNGQIASQIATQLLPNRISLNASRLVVGDQNGNIRMLGVPEGKMIWKNRTGGAIREITAVGDDVMAVSNDNYAYMFSGNNGDTLWKRKLSGRILGSTVFDQEVGVFLSTGSTEALFVNLKDGKIVNRITSGKAEYFVSPPISIGQRIVIPTNIGLEVYGPNCLKPSTSESSLVNTSPKS